MWYRRDKITGDTYFSAGHVSSAIIFVLLSRMLPSGMIVQQKTEAPNLISKSLKSTEL
jgi:hypothetical protein